MLFARDARSVKAPHPDDRSKTIELTVNTVRARRILAEGQVARTSVMFYNVLGIMPPYENIGAYEQDAVFPDHFKGLSRAHALFEGINRPFNDLNADHSIFAYISRQKYVYVPSGGWLSPARREEVPPGMVFVSYVRFAPSKRSGEILDWDFVLADEEDSDLPADFESRYTKRVW